MSVWRENPRDGGSAVWGCTTCHHGAWCPSPLDALTEANRHARRHGTSEPVTVRDRAYGPPPQEHRDARILRLRAAGRSIRQIAAEVGISTAGVTKSLTRSKASA